MRKMAVLLPLAAVLCAGCGKYDPDTAKIDALTQKVDLLARDQSAAISNEFVLFDEIELVRSNTTNLPDLNQVDRIVFYYHTNELNELRGRFDRLDDDNVTQVKFDYWLSEMEGMTNS